MDENVPDWVQYLYQTSERQETGSIDWEAFFVHFSPGTNLVRRELHRFT